MTTEQKMVWAAVFSLAICVNQVGPTMAAKMAAGTVRGIKNLANKPKEEQELIEDDLEMLLEMAKE